MQCCNQSTAKAFRLGREFERHLAAAQAHAEKAKAAQEKGWPSIHHPEADLAQQRLDQALAVQESLLRSAGSRVPASQHAEMLSQLNRIARTLRG